MRQEIFGSNRMKNKGKAKDMLTRPQNTKQLPKISVITPSFNREKYIEMNIKSLLAQSYNNFEHIIIDGGSNDKTLDIIKQYEGKYDMRWISEPDEGMYDAINKGLKLATGDIIAYLNTDDLYMPWTLEVVADIFTRPVNSKVGFIYGDAVRMDLINNRDKLILLSEFRHKIFALGRGMGIVQPSAFIRASVIDKVGYFDKNYNISADSEYWVRIAESGIQHKKIDEILSVEIAHQMALSYNDSSKANYIGDVAKLRNRYVKRYRENIATKIICKAIKIRSKVLYRLILVRFVISCLLYRYLKLQPKQWACFIKHDSKINLRELMLEGFTPHNNKKRVFNPLFRISEEILETLKNKAGI